MVAELIQCIVTEQNKLLFFILIKYSFFFSFFLATELHPVTEAKTYKIDSLPCRIFHLKIVEGR